MRVLGFEIERTKKDPSRKKLIKEAKKTKKQVASTLDWVDIDEIKENHIVLNNGKNKSKTYVKGLKIRPINIFIMSPGEQMRQVSRLRNVFNDIPFKIFHGFVFSPVNLDSELARLMRKLDFEENEQIRTLIQNDIEKMLWFINSWKEIEFYMFVRDTSLQEVEKKLDRLRWDMQNANFIINDLNRIDFENYTAYLFENQLINDYLFGMGAFEIINEKEEQHD